MLPDALAHLGLEPHPEGGFYRERYRSEQLTHIDYVLLARGRSAWHRVLGSDEVWCHHRGGTLRLHLLDQDGYRAVDLGGDRASAVVPAGCWQAAEALDAAWVWVGCTVAPPFRFERFEMADASLLRAFPAEADRIRPLLAGVAP